MEMYQVDIFAFAVLRNLEQIDQTQEAGLARQLWSDIGKTDRLDRIHLDLAFFHPVPGADFDVRTHPDSDTASDFSSTHSVSQPFSEHHSALRIIPAGPRTPAARFPAWRFEHLRTPRAQTAFHPPPLVPPSPSIHPSQSRRSRLETRATC